MSKLPLSGYPTRVDPSVANPIYCRSLMRLANIEHSSYDLNNEPVDERAQIRQWHGYLPVTCELCIHKRGMLMLMLML